MRNSGTDEFQRRALLLAGVRAMAGRLGEHSEPPVRDDARALCSGACDRRAGAGTAAEL